MSATLSTPRIVGAVPRSRSHTTVVHLPVGLSRPLPTPATYRRRRVGAAVFAVALVASVGSMAQHGLADRGGESASAATVGHSHYVVRQGDTMWAIAERLYPGHDLALVVDAMVTLNGGPSLQAGQRLILP